MRYYTKILPRENKRRMTKVRAFRNLVVEYFNNLEGDWLSPTENDRARQLRREINTSLDEAKEIVHAAGVSTIRLHSPAPVRGGFAGPVDVFLNIFQLRQAQMEPSLVTDDLERAWGIYSGNQGAAKLRLINPFYYLARLLELLSEIPFAIIGALGFNREKVEGSKVGRFLKGLIEVTGWIAVMLPALELLGWLEHIRSFFSHK